MAAQRASGQQAFSMSSHVHGMQLTFKGLGLGWELAPCRNLMLVQETGEELALLLGHLQGRGGSFGEPARMTFCTKACRCKPAATYRTKGPV